MLSPMVSTIPIVFLIFPLFYCYFYLAYHSFPYLKMCIGPKTSTPILLPMEKAMPIVLSDFFAILSRFHIWKCTLYPDNNTPSLSPILRNHTYFIQISCVFYCYYALPRPWHPLSVSRFFNLAQYTTRGLDNLDTIPCLHS